MFCRFRYDSNSCRLQNKEKDSKASPQLLPLLQRLSRKGPVQFVPVSYTHLARGDFQVIGATTVNEYRKYIEKDSALERRFQPVQVGEPSEEEAVQILEGLKDRYEAHHKVQITDEAIDSAVRLSSRYIADRYLPDKAIAVSYTHLHRQGFPRRMIFGLPTGSLSYLREHLIGIDFQGKCDYN